MGLRYDNTLSEDEHAMTGVVGCLLSAACFQNAYVLFEGLSFVTP